jgi:hypothetical protein
MTTYTSGQHDLVAAGRGLIGKTVQFERHTETVAEVHVGTLTRIYRRNEGDGRLTTTVCVSDLNVIIATGGDREPVSWLLFPADEDQPVRAEVVHEGPFDVVAARYDHGTIGGYEEADVVERLAPDAWRVVFGDGHSAGVFEHELRVRPRDIEKLRAMEVGPRP